MDTMPYSHKSVLIDLLDAKVKEFDEADDLNLSSYIDGLREAQTFRLPHRGSLPTISDYSLFYEFMKAPYHSFLIEMPTNDGGWLILNVMDHSEMKTLTEEINKKVDILNKRKWWQFKKGTEKKAECSFSGLVCALYSQHKDGEWGVFGSFKINMDENKYEMIENSIEKIPDKVASELAWEVLRFLVVVNTPNIKQLEIKPPKLINAKRKKKGKPLLEGYKYLDLIPREQLNHGSTGTGATRRMHWRRGHIRRLADRTTWVRPALIGKEGFVDKTYRI